MCAAEMQRNASKSDRNIGLDFQQDWTFLQVAQAYPALRLASAEMRPRLRDRVAPPLRGLMIDYGVGVSTRQVYEIKAVDTDFFDE